MYCDPPGSSVHGISQVRILDWVALSFSKISSLSRDRTCVSCIGRLWQAYSLLLSHQVDKGRNDTHWCSVYEIAILAKSLAETVHPH